MIPTPSQPTTNTISYYEALGMMMWLMKHADYHSQWPLWNVEADILPALLHGQVKLYFDDEQNPVGFVTWAWLDDASQEQALLDEEPLEFDQWNCGEQLLFVDFVAPWEHTKNIMIDLRTNVFQEDQAISLSRNPNGTIRKVYCWKGVSFQKQIMAKQRRMNTQLLNSTRA